MASRSPLEALTSRLLALGPEAWSLLLVLVAVVVALIYLVRRRSEHRRARATLEEAVRTELHVPPSLHPVIDPDVCIGSGSCIQACPEGQILGLVGGVAKLINASSCIGHGRCAAECPVSAIKLVFGSAERGVDLPEIDGSFETSRPGVYIVGELGGMARDQLELHLDVLAQHLVEFAGVTGEARRRCRIDADRGWARGGARRRRTRCLIVADLRDAGVGRRRGAGRARARQRAPRIQRRNRQRDNDRTTTVTVRSRRQRGRRGGEELVTRHAVRLAHCSRTSTI